MIARKGILKQLEKDCARGKKNVALLIDPDKADDRLEFILRNAEISEISFYLVGGSLLIQGDFNETIRRIKRFSQKPVIIFPGNTDQISSEADAILFLSLISGRNPEFLIGRHVEAAPKIKKSGLEVISTAYILIESGGSTTVSYISGTNPIPADKPEIVACTALAGQFLGLKTIYLEAGSGARNPVSPEVIRIVKKTVECPIFVGGGIKQPDQALTLGKAGADILVVGNLAENNPEKLIEICHAFYHSQ